VNVEDVRTRRVALDRRIAAVRRRWAHPVEIVAVTKGFDGEVIGIAADAGFAAVGENYAQELLTKTAEIEAAGVEVHFIGRLQTNKVRLVAGVVDVWSSLDRPSVIDEVAKRAPGARVLVQVDTADDPGKGGARPDDVRVLVDRARSSGLNVEGLMTVGPTGRPPADARPGFRTVRRLVDELGLEVCSMGMSGDLDVAVEEGSTEVRVGTDLFGPRPVHRRPAGLG
jgi:pyridoxal phosphate enzyme (YggS family)